MTAASRLALGLAIASLALSAYFVGSSPEALQQLRALDLPLTGLGERAIGMLIPLLLSTVAGIFGLVAALRRAGWAPLVAAAASWAVASVLLGTEGFHFLF
jgi:hypothetical protein